jgi:conjugal transfer pilus assembly protein TrbC
MAKKKLLCRLIIKILGKPMTKKLFITISLIISLLGIASFARADSSYIEFAQAQAAKIASITAPYNADISQIKNKFTTQQAPLDDYLIKKSSESIFIFVSFSMPEISLKQWLAQAHRTGASVIIRGLINNSFKETLSAMNRLVSDNTGGLLLDPTLFQKFDIKQVPAVVVSQSNTCTDEKNCLPRFDVIYGDVTLDYALQQLHDKRGENDV